jgi:hypothetical protein
MFLIEDTMAWAQTVFGKAQLGDRRRTQRLIDLAAAKAENAPASLPKAMETPANTEGAYRFLRNPHFSGADLMESAFASTADLLSSCNSDIIVVQDTTSLSYEHDLTGAGPLGGPKNSGAGVWVHSALALLPTRQVVGLVDQHYWARDPKKAGLRHQRKQRAYQDKESYKWEETSRHAASRLGPTIRRCVEVADREADILEYISYLQVNQHRFVIRSSRNRKLASGGKLHEPSTYPLMGEVVVPLEQRGDRSPRPERMARCTVRAGTVTLDDPRRLKPEAPELSVIHVCEIDPPPGQTRLEWWLLSSEPIASWQDVSRVISYYKLRWSIEEFHKAWKSGTKVEELRVQSLDNLLRIAPVLAQVAVRLLQLRDLRRESPTASCEEMLDRTQWQVLWISINNSRPPKKPPTMDWAYRALARLGGWGDTKRTGRASWETLFRGMIKLQERVAGWQLAKNWRGTDEV